MALAQTITEQTAAYPFHANAIETSLTHSPDNASATSWGAIFAGATIAAAASLVLLSLGTGLGLSSISPWAQKGVHATSFGVSSIVWVIVTQLCASALGGYLAGRLRTRWTTVHADEVYFRDTAHGLLSWAMATLLTAAILLAAASSAAGAAAQASATLAYGPMGYLVDSLFRRDAAVSGTTAAAFTDSPIHDAVRLPMEEVTRIFVNASGADAAALPQSDVRYLGQVVAQRTGLQQADAERRVTETYATLRTGISNAKSTAAEVADKARKVAVQVSLWLFIALLSGAFIASYTAMLGGRERDA